MSSLSQFRNLSLRALKCGGEQVTVITSVEVTFLSEDITHREGRLLTSNSTHRVTAHTVMLLCNFN